MGTILGRRITQQELTGLTLPDLRNQRDPYRPHPMTGDKKNSSQVRRQDNRILLDNIRALKERIKVAPEEVPETEVVKHTSQKGNYETTADHEEPDRGMRSVATHTPTSNIVPENDDLIQTFTISFQGSALGCKWKTEELMPAMASVHLKLHHEAKDDVN